ncbi:MAG: hypothetical protein KTR20_03430 [Cellvibrionaceae bacterium]|nr:hypothetical protein [Cellvibrionaceae bacterium]
MIDTLSHYLKQHFSLVLIAALLAGLSLPHIEHISPAILLALLGSTIFFSCFQIKMVDLSTLCWPTCITFYGLRFILLPIVLYLSLSPWMPLIATGLLLYALMPTGVSAPGITHICGGNLALSLAMLTVSSLLAPFVIPSVTGLFVGQSIAIDTWGLFSTLLMTLFIPLLLHIPLRTLTPLTNTINRYSTLIISALIVGQIIAVVGGYRTSIMASLSTVPLYFLAAMALFAVFYGLGWWFSPHAARANRIALAVASGCNNSIMGIVLASLYLAPSAGIFLLSAQLCWVLIMAVANSYWQRHKQ